MDGRTVYAVSKFFEREYGIKYVDTITDAGPVQHCANDKELERIKYRVVEVSVGKHYSKHIAVVAHEECAGNPISKEEQLDQLQTYVDIVRGWFSDESEISVFGLWCERSAEGWVAIPSAEILLEQAA